MTSHTTSKRGAAQSPSKSRRRRIFDEAARQAIVLKCAAAAMKVRPSPTPTYKPLPSLERLQELFEYRPDTGKLINRIARGGLKVGDVAGLKSPDRFGGYVTVYVDCQPYRGHRICFKIHHGRDPDGQIDHINGDRADNRIANLREVTPLQNARNRHAVSGKVPVIGVSICSRSNRYIADIGIGNKIIRLGEFDNLQCAVAARRHAEHVAFDLPGKGRVG